jgi:TRAP-type C4-dicarboxylate transport system substrate-binding protein
MGDEPQLVRKLKLGQLHTIGVTVSGIGQLVPEILVLDLPFLFKNYDEIDAVLEHLRPRFEAFARERGYEIMAILDQGIIRTFSRYPIPHPKDQLDRKVWGWSGEEVSLKNLEALKIVPVALPVPEVLTGLQTGLIDTIHTSITALVALQWHTQIKYGYWNPLRYEPAVVLFSRKSLERLPAGKREEFMEFVRRAGAPYIQRLQEIVRSQEKELMQALKEKGITITSWSAEDMKWWEERAQPLYSAFVGQFYPKSLVDEVLGFLKEYRSRQGAKR